MNQFKLNVQQLQELSPAQLHIIAGDFNARVGKLNQLEDEDVLPNPTWTPERQSKDENVCDRGETLMEFFDEIDYVVLNGRSTSDECGDLTFISQSVQSTHKSCGSVIDLCCVNLSSLDSIKDFEVLQVSGSDHFPISISLTDKACFHPQQVGIRLKWNSELEEIYDARIQSKLHTSPNKKLHEIILEAAKELKMISKGIPPGFKPWFDSECQETRKFLRQLQRQAKQENW